jgi:hypothetical protein
MSQSGASIATGAGVRVVEVPCGAVSTGRSGDNVLTDIEVDVFGGDTAIPCHSFKNFN